MSRSKPYLRKKAKETCPECGKDIHDPDCPFNELAK
jgi:hypothetical protein